MKQYLWLLPAGLMPATALAWAIVFPVQLAAARKIPSRPFRLLIAVAALATFFMLASVMNAAWLRQPISPVDLLILAYASTYSVFGVGIPWVYVTARSLRDTSEKWWQASLLGAGIVVADAIVWVLMGAILGAQRG